MNTIPSNQNKVTQFTTVYHIEYGKGYVVSLTPKMKDMLCMCYFPIAKVSDWCLLSHLSTGTDEYMSLTVAQTKVTDEGSTDALQEALNNLFGGGR